MAAVASPSSSPRLPSPPPAPEDQLGPKSPLLATEEQQKLFSSLDNGAARRIRPGTKAEDMAEGPPLVDLSEIDSAFQLTEHLKALHYFLTHPDGTNSTIAVDRDMARKLAQPPENVDKTLWLYELCRFLTQKVNSIIIALFADQPPCSAQTCPEMRASEWQYLCAVHEPPKACCAIDYCCHTLDWAANTLTSTKAFPSRLALGTDQSSQHQQIRHLTNIFRRVYRIFAHAWFQHRDMFWKVEGRTGLYIFFKTVCDSYGLIPEDNYTIPAEAEGEDEQETEAQAEAPKILRREASGPAQESGSSSFIEGVADHTLSTAGTTKRHRHSPSVGANTISSVVEEAEEDDEAPLRAPSVVSAIHDEPSEEAGEAEPENATASEEQPIEEKEEVAEQAEGQVDGESAEQTVESEKDTTDEAEKEENSDPESSEEQISTPESEKSDPLPETEAFVKPDSEETSVTEDTEKSKVEGEEIAADTDKGGEDKDNEGNDEKEEKEKPISDD